MATKKQKRVSELSKALSAHKTLHIRDAAELLDVSEMTVRRDIRDHPDLFEFLGGHIMAPESHPPRAPYDLTQEAEINQGAKRAACQHALPFVRPKDTIFVDCGTTLAHLVHILPHEMEVTIICYALNIADLAVRRAKVNLVLLGGAYHQATASFYPVTDDPALHDLAINTAFFSAAGLDLTLGATCTTFREAKLKRAAMARAQASILVVDESKLGAIKPACFASPQEFNLILTENGPLRIDAD